MHSVAVHVWSNSVRALVRPKAIFVSLRRWRGGDDSHSTRSLPRPCVDWFLRVRARVRCCTLLQVVDVDYAAGRATIKLVPRLDLTAMAKDHLGGTSRRRGRVHCAMGALRAVHACVSSCALRVRGCCM